MILLSTGDTELFIILFSPCSDLWKPKDAVADVVPRLAVANKAPPQVLLQGPNAYCVHVNVYPSIFENS